MLGKEERRRKKTKSDHHHSIPVPFDSHGWCGGGSCAGCVPACTLCGGGWGSSPPDGMVCDHQRGCACKACCDSGKMRF